MSDQSTTTFRAHYDEPALQPFGAPRILPIRETLPTQAPERIVPDAVFVRDRTGLQRIFRSEIRSLVADGNYVELHTADKRFVLRNSLKEVLQQLNDDRFAQVNRNTVINVDRLARVDCDCVEVDGHHITLSRSFRSALLDRLNILCGR